MLIRRAPQHFRDGDPLHCTQLPRTSRWRTERSGALRLQLPMWCPITNHRQFKACTMEGLSSRGFMLWPMAAKLKTGQKGDPGRQAPSGPRGFGPPDSLADCRLDPHAMRLWATPRKIPCQPWGPCSRSRAEPCSRSRFMVIVMSSTSKIIIVIVLPPELAAEHGIYLSLLSQHTLRSQNSLGRHGHKVPVTRCRPENRSHSCGSPSACR